MTKNEMKETIRKRINDNWNVLKVMTNVYGINSNEAKINRRAWSELDDLWNTLFPNEDWGDEQ